MGSAPFLDEIAGSLAYPARVAGINSLLDEVRIEDVREPMDFSRPFDVTISNCPWSVSSYSAS